MTRTRRWSTLAGITAGLLGLTVQASGATGFALVTPQGLAAGTQSYVIGSFALSDTDAWAVGESATTHAPLVLRWNGSIWSAVPSPAPSGTTPNWTLESVGASGAGDAWAVGVQTAGTKVHDSLYEHWNGTAWSVVTGPNEGILNAVLDFSPTNAWAFADFSVLHWDGNTWSVVSGALPALRVSADGPDDIWGVSVDNIVTHYDGTSWTSTTLSAPSGTPDFQSVAALSPTDVWAAGSIGNGPVLDHFNGTAWQQMKLPSAFSSFGLNRITARSDSDVWVFSNTGSPNVPLLLANWNGSSWTTSASPLPSNTLASPGSAANSPSHVWLFGDYVSSTLGEQPMILDHS